MFKSFSRLIAYPYACLGVRALANDSSEIFLINVCVHTLVFLDPQSAWMLVLSIQHGMIQKIIFFLVFAKKNVLFEYNYCFVIKTLSRSAHNSFVDTDWTSIFNFFVGIVSWLFFQAYTSAAISFCVRVNSWYCST